MKPKLEAGQAVTCVKGRHYEELNGKWGFIAAEPVWIKCFWAYYVFFPEAPYPTQMSEPGPLSLCYFLYDEHLEPLNEI